MLPTIRCIWAIRDKYKCVDDHLKARLYRRSHVERTPRTRARIAVDVLHALTSIWLRTGRGPKPAGPSRVLLTWFLFERCLLYRIPLVRTLSGDPGTARETNGSNGDTGVDRK